MSEKRFSWKTEKLKHLDDEVLLVVDNENKEWEGHILNIVDLLNEQETRIDLLEKGILDCLFEDKSIGMFALDMGLVE